LTELTATRSKTGRNRPIQEGRFNFRRYRNQAARGKRYRRRKSNPMQARMTELLADDVILNIRQTSLTPCTPKYLTVICGCSSTEGARDVRSGCMKADCPDCADQLRKRRAVRITRRLETIRRGRPILYTDFTVPPDYRKPYGVRFEWRNVVKKLVGVLKESYGLELALEYSHPIGDEDPDRFHPHLNLLWIQRPPYKPFFEPEDLEKLRTIWRRLLGITDDTQPVVLHHSYTNEYRVYPSGPKKGKRIPVKAQIMHLAKYVARPFPGLSTWIGSVRWYGKLVKLPDEIIVCPKCKQMYHVLFFLSEEEYEERHAPVEPGAT
jgi:hypothetical protein